MPNFPDFEFFRQFNNLVIIALGVIAIVIVLRGVFKVAWRVIKLVLIVMGVLVLLGLIFGQIRILFL